MTMTELIVAVEFTLDLLAFIAVICKNAFAYQVLFTRRWSEP